MKFLFAFLLMVSGFAARAQNYVLPDGEYMDTAVNNDTACKDMHVYFYQVGGIYPESSSTLLEKTRAFLLSKGNVYSGSGYITFRFTVGCNGKVFRKVQVLQTDEAYTGRHFDKRLVGELYDFFGTLDKWRIAKLRTGLAVPYAAFLTFKMKNGQVINIIP